MFQNNPEARMIIVSEDVGTFGVTFTAATATVLDDLPDTYTRLYQLWDRIHRIDQHHSKEEVRYYRLEARFPKKYIDGKDWPAAEKAWFRISYDQGQWRRLTALGELFHFLVDIGLSEQQIEREVISLREQMPWMFGALERDEPDTNGETVDSSEAENIEQASGMEETAPIEQTVDVYTHPSVAGGALSLIPERWHLGQVTGLGESVEEANAGLEEAGRKAAEGQVVLIAVDAAYRDGLKLPPKALVIILSPTTLNRVDTRAVAGYLEQPWRLAGLLIDLTFGSVIRFQELPEPASAESLRQAA